MPMTPGRDFPATLADMQYIYGLNGATPMPVHASRVSSSSPRSTSSSSSSFSFSRLMRKKDRTSTPSTPSPTPSSSSRSSMDSQLTLTTPISAPSASKPMQAPRDYEAAFGALSSSYGFNGAGPTFVPVMNPSTPSSTSRSSRRKTNRSKAHSEMDEQTAHLGNLLSQYGVSSGPSVGGTRR